MLSMSKLLSLAVILGGALSPLCAQGPPEEPKPIEVVIPLVNAMKPAEMEEIAFALRTLIAVSAVVDGRSIRVTGTPEKIAFSKEIISNIDIPAAYEATVLRVDRSTLRQSGLAPPKPQESEATPEFNRVVPDALVSSLLGSAGTSIKHSKTLRTPPGGRSGYTFNGYTFGTTEFDIHLRIEPASPSPGSVPLRIKAFFSDSEREGAGIPSKLLWRPAREAAYEARVSEGETLLIGGVVRERNPEADRGLPSEIVIAIKPIQRKPE
jgi:hypothetical protein